MIDLYCERVGAGLLAEPLNAATNACFLLAAWSSWQGAGGRRDVCLLALTLAAIGLGSAAFHTYATVWAQWLDVLPIAGFQLGYLWLYLRRVAAVRRGTALLLLALYCAATAAAAQQPHLLNGSMAYLPAAAALVLVGLWHYRTARAAPAAILIASLLFAVSLMARTIDNAVCAQWPAGTHWLWHVLNALVLFLLVRAYGQSVPAPARPRA